MGNKVSFGWALQATYCGSDAGAGVFAVNVILPGASRVADEWWLPTNAIAMPGEKALAAFGGLLRPWDWNDPLKMPNPARWQAFAWDPQKQAWASVQGDTIPKPAAPTNAKAIQAGANAWLKSTSGACEAAFSLEPKYTAHEKRSLCHALAPMTHLPAPLSGATLGASGHFRVDVVAAGDSLVMFPAEVSAGVGGQARSWVFDGEPKGDPAKGIVVATYKEQIAAAGDELKVGGEEVVLRFVSQAAVVDSAAIQPPKPAQIMKGAIGGADLRRIVARYFHPAAVLSAALEEGIDPNSPPDPDRAPILASDCAMLFAWSLGAGDIGAPVATGGLFRRQMFAELVLEPRRVRAAWDDNHITSKAVAADARAALADWTKTAGQLPKGIEDFLKSHEPKLLGPALAALRAEADSAETKLFAPWFKVLATRFLPQAHPLKQELIAALDGSKEQPGFGRLAFPHRLSTLRSMRFWNLVKGEEPEKELRAALDQVLLHFQVEAGLAITGRAAWDAAMAELKHRLWDIAAPSVLSDPGLKIVFESDLREDQSIRGFAVALQPGLGADAATVNPAPFHTGWITDTGLVMKDLTWVAGTGRPMIAHETIGSTYEAGLRVASLEYAGRPVTSALADPDGELSDPTVTDDPAKREFLFDNRWPQERHTGPLLAYGAWYRVTAALLDNAGGELANGRPGRTDLGAANDRFAAGAGSPWQRYLSLVRPGAPTIAGIPVWRTELSEETRFHASWTPQSSFDKPPPVVTIASAQAHWLEAVSKQLKITIVPPVTDRGFVERWFNQEILAAAEADKPDLRKQRDEWAQREATKRFHPAVRAVRVELTEEDGVTKHIGVIQLDGAGFAPPGPKDFAISVDAYAVSSTGASIPQGRFGTLRFISLVESRYAMPGADCRFEPSIATLEGNWWPVAASEMRVEALPDSFAAPALKDDWLSMSMVGLSEEIGLGLAKAVDAKWLRRFSLERHEWHWTGYDVRFPSEPKSLADLAHAFVNVGSYRMTVESRALATDGALQAPVQPLHRHSLPAVRGARFFAFAARPVLRFRQWLREDFVAKHEAPVIATGGIVPGKSLALGDRRVPVPAWTDAIPLCQTYSADGADTSSGRQYGRVANGALLVFDEPIRRTDELVSLGGLGETIDIDVVETRIPGQLEQGLNPIFHPNTPIPRTLPFQFEISQPFGLTHDLGQNPKVAQTAVVVRPGPSVLDGRWFMCKARARRLYLPELMADSEVELKAGVFWLPTREEQEWAVVADFCIDFEGGPDTFTCRFLDPFEKDLVLPTWPAGFERHKLTKYRVLITWHKARWRQTDLPSWRPQACLQVPDGDRLGWRTIAQTTGNAQDAMDLALSVDLVQMEVSAKDGAGAPWPKPIKVRRVMASDYTEPQWISFIGSFDRLLKAPDEYRLRRVGSKLELQELRYGAWAKAEWDLAAPERDLTRFQLLMLYGTRADAMRGQLDVTAGEVKSWFKPDAARGEFAEFSGGSADGASYAYLLSFQRRNAGTVPAFANWPAVLAGMFPALEKECSVRLLPEYLGPIKIE